MAKNNQQPPKKWGTLIVKGRKQDKVITQSSKDDGKTTIKKEIQKKKTPEVEHHQGYKYIKRKDLIIKKNDEGGYILTRKNGEKLFTILDETTVSDNEITKIAFSKATDGCRIWYDNGTELFELYLKKDRSVGLDIIPRVGLGATYKVSSDAYPYTIVEVLSEKRIVVKSDDYHYNKETKKYTFTRRENASGKILTKRRDRRWRTMGSGSSGTGFYGCYFTLGHRRYHYDMSK